VPKSKKESENTRSDVLDGAGRNFRSHGFGGASVDAIARDAGVTAGAFYGHFRSKADAFREALAAGLSDLRRGIVAARERDGARWIERFAEFYMGDRRTCALAESCALQSLTVDAARADDATRSAFEAEWIGIRDAAAEGFAGDADERRAHATALLALLAGGVSVARAVRRREVGEAIAEAVRDAATKIGAPQKRVRPKPKPDDASSESIDRRGGSPPTSDRAAIVERVRVLEDAWNARDASRIARSHDDTTYFRARAEIACGRSAIEALVERAFAREIDGRRVMELFAFTEDRVVARAVSEWRDDSGNWFRSAGAATWEIDAEGFVRRYEESFNDTPIREADRLFRWPRGPRPSDHPGANALAL
jgi:nuclear transport factor 2 (NTF2) superfamily protein/AcrR family transcriptional regulator